MEQKLLNEKRFSNRKQITKQYFKPENGMITIAEVVALIEELQAEAVAENKQEFQLMVRGLASDKWTTLQGFSSPFNEDAYGDYLQNKVADNSKFKEFFQLQVTTIESI